MDDDAPPYGYRHYSRFHASIPWGLIVSALGFPFGVLLLEGLSAKAWTVVAWAIAFAVINDVLVSPLARVSVIGLVGEESVALALIGRALATIAANMLLMLVVQAIASVTVATIGTALTAGAIIGLLAFAGRMVGYQAVQRTRYW